MVCVHTERYAITSPVDIGLFERDTVVRGPTWHNTYAQSMENGGIPEDLDFNSWRDNGIQKSLDVVPVGPENGLYEPLEGDARAANSIVDVPFNKVGEYFSRIENVDGHLKKVLFDAYRKSNPDTRGFIKFLEEQGYTNPMEIIRRGAENTPDARARLHYDGKTSTVVLNKDISQMARELAQEYGISESEAEGLAIEYIVRNSIYHELTHNQGVIKGSKAYKEMTVGELLGKFYDKLAKSGSKEMASLYQKLAESNKDYAEGYSGINALILSYIQEALELGYDSEQAEEYVSKRLKQESGKSRSELEDKVEKESKNGSKETGEETEKTDEDTDGEESEAQEDGAAEE